ncbi:MAG: glycosyltransferase [Candidatus Helarchaeota archaeon]
MRSRVLMPGIIIPVKNPPFPLIIQVLKSIKTLPLPKTAMIVVDGSNRPNATKVKRIVTQFQLPYVYEKGNKHLAIDKGITYLTQQGKVDMIIVLDDDSFIDMDWVLTAMHLLACADLVWGFGICSDPGWLAGLVNVDLNAMVALLDQEYWLESGVYAFRLDAYQAVGGFGRSGTMTLSDDHALGVKFIKNGKKIKISPALHHRLVNYRGIEEWFKQKIRWMGEILLISLRNVLLLLIAIPLIFTAPLLMWKASKITNLSFPLKTYWLAPIAFLGYTFALLLAYRDINQRKGIAWKNRRYYFNLSRNK